MLLEAQLTLFGDDNDDRLGIITFPFLSRELCGCFILHLELFCCCSRERYCESSESQKWEAAFAISNFSHQHSELSPDLQKEIEVWNPDRVWSGAVVLYLFSRTLLNIANVNGKCCLSFSGEQVAPEAGELKEYGICQREKQPTEKKGNGGGSWITFFTTHLQLCPWHLGRQIGRYS